MIEHLTGHFQNLHNFFIAIFWFTSSFIENRTLANRIIMNSLRILIAKCEGNLESLQAYA